MTIGPDAEDVNVGKVTAVIWKPTDSLNLNAVAILDFKHGWAAGPNGTIARFVNHAINYRSPQGERQPAASPLPTK